MRACATIAPGLRSIVHDEIREIGLSPVDDELDNAGWAAFDVDGPGQLLAALGRLRTLHRMGVVLAEGRVDREEPWDGLDELVDQIDVQPWFSGGPFAVRGHRTGEHAFTSMDVAAHVGGRLHDHLEAELGERPPVDLDDPDAIVRAHIDDDGNVRLWLDLAGQAGLHRRGYRAYDHPAGMKASLASAMLALADHQASGPFADPMAGGGTLVAETAWRTLGISPMQLRGDELLAWNAPILRERRQALGSPRPLADPSQPPSFVLGDHAPNHVQGALANLQAAGIADHVESYVADASELPKHVEEAELVATNPPYGIRSGDGSLEDTYRSLVDAALASLRSDGRLGLMTPKIDLVEQIAEERGLALAADEEVRHGRLTIRLLVLER